MDFRIRPDNGDDDGRRRRSNGTREGDKRGALKNRKEDEGRHKEEEKGEGLGCQ